MVSTWLCEKTSWIWAFCRPCFTNPEASRLLDIAILLTLWSSQNSFWGIFRGHSSIAQTHGVSYIFPSRIHSMEFCAPKKQPESASLRGIAVSNLHKNTSSSFYETCKVETPWAEKGEKRPQNGWFWWCVVILYGVKLYNDMVKFLVDTVTLAWILWVCPEHGRIHPKSIGWKRHVLHYYNGNSGSECHFP